MVIDLTELREEMQRRLEDSGETDGIESAVGEYGEIDLDDPDTILSLARAEGIDLSEYQIGTTTPPDHETMDTDLDTDHDLDDMNDDVDDLDGEYY